MVYVCLNELIGSSLTKAMAYYLFDIKPLGYSMLLYSPLDF